MTLLILAPFTLLILALLTVFSDPFMSRKNTPTIAITFVVGAFVMAGVAIAKLFL